jgi:hypothetical protein
MEALGLNCTSHFADFSRVAGRKTNKVANKSIFQQMKEWNLQSLTIQDILWGRK